MDRKYYYRLLGLQEGAAADKIEAAYKEKLRKLSSADYADDPEYVFRKKQQIKDAYHVLTGNAVPVLKTEKSKRSREDYEDRSERKERRTAQRTAQRTSSRTSTGGKQITAGKVASTIFTAAFLIFWGIGFFGGMLDLFIGGSSDYEDVFDRISEIHANAEEYQYEEHLYYSDVTDDRKDVDWDSEGDYDDIYVPLDEIAYGMEVGHFSNIVQYVTDDEDFYYNNNDYECSKKVVDFMEAPAFEDVAGYINLYSGDPILTYDDYLWFLADVAGEQTEEILGEIEES